MCNNCKQGQHFFWDCPNYGNQSLVQIAEEQLKKNGGQLLLSKLGKKLRDSSPNFENFIKKYDGKLMKWIAVNQDKFSLTNLDKPGYQTVILNGYNINNNSPVQNPKPFNKDNQP
jgi:hypothetical protein